MPAVATKFRGIKYGVKVKKRLVGGATGLCDTPNTKKPSLWFEKRLWKKKHRNVLVEVLIHESLHACFWDMSEEAVDEAGKDIARFLKKMGVIRIPKKPA